MIELEHRENNGINVTLYWDELGNSPIISLTDVETKVQSMFAVPAESAMDAFQHPYPYYYASLDEHIEKVPA